MSEHDREGPETPPGDDALEHAWRQASAEQPSPKIDAAILAAARDAARGRGEASTEPSARSSPQYRPSRWQPFAVAAAVAGLAFVLVQTLPRDPLFAPRSTQREMPVTAPAAEYESPTPETREEIDAASAQAQSTGARQTSSDTVPPPPPPAPRTVPTPERAVSDPAPAAESAAADGTGPDSADNAESADSRSVDGPEGAVSAGGAAGAGRAATAGRFERRKADASEMSAGAAPSVAAVPAPPERPERPDDVAPADAEAWADRVAALHDSGNLVAAAAALRAFRSANPRADSHLPARLRAWARTVE